MRISIAIAAALALGGCEWTGWSTDGPQGWGQDARQAWYRATQGSRLMPEVWFTALEVGDAEARFASPENLDQYNFVWEADGVLPVGFTRDAQDDTDLKVTKLRWVDGQGSKEPWIGLNCAACHTNRIDYKGSSFIVDGAPGMLDFQKFVDDLDAAQRATLDDPAKFTRFAKAVLGSEHSAASEATLKASFADHLAWQEQAARMNDTPLEYGFGRLDAVGHILNKVLMFNGATARQGNASNAPVSYPFIWNIWKQHRVQWNGVALNSEIEVAGNPFLYGALGRNTGEVLGVFGEVIISPQDGVLGDLQGYKSSVRVSNLDSLERVLMDLKSPEWREEFPALNPRLVNEGRALFGKHCADCHKDPDSGNDNLEVMTFFKDTPAHEMTDIWMACNAFLYAGPTGNMKGMDAVGGGKIGDTAQAAAMLAVAVKGSLLEDKPEILGVAARSWLGINNLPKVEILDEAPALPGAIMDPRSEERQACMEAVDSFPDEGSNILAYKARPLDGIWATAPYLHNGSVQSLYELLLPARQRKTEFWVGNPEFDANDVGFVDADPGNGKGFLLKIKDPAGNDIPGNSNAGHEYGAGQFSEEERRAMVEYMKSL